MVLPELSLDEVQYEYEHRYETRVQWIYANIAVSLLAATIAVILRFVARRKRGLKIAWNDYTIVVALVITIAICGLVIRATTLGLGIHVVLIGKTKALEVAKMLTFEQILFPLAGSTIRLSVLMFYVQVFGTTIGWFINGVRILAAAWLSLALVAFLCTAIQCVPLKLAWTSNHAQHCLNIEKFILSMTIYGVCLNFFTLFLPLPLIWRLRLNMRKKIGIVALFALAGGDIVINILRAIETHEISPNVIDVSYRQVNNSILAILELTIAIVCACIPTLQPLFNRLSSKMSEAIDRADVKNQVLTVPFVLHKTKTAGTKSDHSKVRLQTASKFLRHSSIFAIGDEEKLVDTQLPPYSQISEPKSTWRGIFTKSGKFSRWPGSRNKDDLSTDKTLLGTENSTFTWKPETPLQGEIAQSFLQSGYPKARYTSSPRPQQQPATDPEPDSVFTLPVKENLANRSRSTSRTKGLNIDTRDTTVRPESRNKQTSRTSPFTGLSSATLMGSPENRSDPHPSRKIQSPVEAKGSHDPRNASQRDLNRRPSGPTLTPVRYQPFPPSPAKTPPARENTGKRKGPRYVRSPLTDPDEKIRFGTPKEVMISTPRQGTPSRGRSLKHQASRSGESEPEPEMPKPLEPYYHNEIRLDALRPLRDSAVPSPLQVEPKVLGSSSAEKAIEDPHKTVRDWFANYQQLDADRLPRSEEVRASPRPDIHHTPSPLKVHSERWYVEPNATTSFAWKDAGVPPSRLRQDMRERIRERDVEDKSQAVEHPQGKRKEKPLPPLPIARESEVSLF